MTEAVRAVAIYTYSILRGEPLKKEYERFLTSDDKTIFNTPNPLVECILTHYLTRICVKFNTKPIPEITNMLRAVNDKGPVRQVKAGADFKTTCYNLALLLALRAKELEGGRDLGDKRWQLQSYLDEHMDPVKLQCQGCPTRHTKPLKLCSLCKVALFCSEPCLKAHKCSTTTK